VDGGALLVKKTRLEMIDPQLEKAG
jgi:hypothetical protein